MCCHEREEDEVCRGGQHGMANILVKRSYSVFVSERKKILSRVKGKQ
jgi:hypothetical protein